MGGIAANAQALADDPAEKPPAEELAPDGPLNLDDFPADYVDEIVVPVPGEILGVLDKLGESDWAAERRAPTRAKFRNRTGYALALGVSVAEGFVAVQAEDAAAVEVAGREVLRYAEALGLKPAVTRHCQAIFESGKAGDWNAVRRELDLTERTARATMEKMDDGDLAGLISIGGWARGTEVACAVIAKAFTMDKAELLNQPDLVSHFSIIIEGLEEDEQKKPKIVALSSALEKIEKLMGTGDSALPSDVVVEMNEAVSGVVDLITGIEPKKKTEE